jgi:hypothetical protein
MLVDLILVMLIIIVLYIAVKGVMCWLDDGECVCR